MKKSTRNVKATRTLTSNDLARVSGGGLVGDVSNLVAKNIKVGSTIIYNVFGVDGHVDINAA